MRRPVRLLAAAAAMTLIVAACGDDDDEEAEERVPTTASTVAGPHVDALAPASVPANQAFGLDVRVSGIELVKADGDRSGRTGHLHLFVDREPTPARQPIPAGDPAIIHSATVPVAVPGLRPGQHTLFVVLGDGAHFPFEPSVTDKVTLAAR